MATDSVGDHGHRLPRISRFTVSRWVPTAPLRRRLDTTGRAVIVHTRRVSDDVVSLVDVTSSRHGGRRRVLIDTSIARRTDGAHGGKNLGARPKSFPPTDSVLRPRPVADLGQVLAVFADPLVVPPRACPFPAAGSRVGAEPRSPSMSASRGRAGWSGRWTPVRRRQPG
jgi:hypothetical protein